MSDLCRRSVLKGVAVSCGAGLLGGCGEAARVPASQPASAPAAGAGASAPGGVLATLAQVSDVPVGGAVSGSAPDGTKVLITRPAEDEVLAFVATCPHEGCSVAPDDEQLSCPCHGSRFDLEGKVQRGPAERDLTAFPVRVMDGQVLPA